MSTVLMEVARDQICDILATPFMEKSSLCTDFESFAYIPRQDCPKMASVGAFLQYTYRVHRI